MELAELTNQLDALLETDTYSDIDPSANGLQVGPENKSVEHAVFAVDAATATIEAAADAGGDLLVTHHGIIWGGLDRVTDRSYKQVQQLIDNDIALYVSHLPLDGHPEIGNAAVLAQRLDLENRKPFGTMGPVTVGQQGRTPTPIELDDFVEGLRSMMPIIDRELRVLPAGPETIETVGIVTGSGTDWIEEAAAADLDVLVTGEGKQAAYHECHERGVNLILAGHYATETGGIQALQSRVADQEIKTTYVEHPTGF